MGAAPMIDHDKYKPENTRVKLRPWAEALFHNLNEMGHRCTNPVLLMLGKAKKVEPFKHYPEEAYQFGNEYWRAYYHCHHSPLNLDQEHGHMHFFTRNHAQGKWAHCFALSMNSLGQPVYMFTTNLWVTMGEWLETKNLLPALHHLEQSETDTTLIEWFKYFVLLYQGEIVDLLNRRDDAVSVYCDGDIKNCQEDRNLYQLSILPIHLQNKLGTILVDKPVNNIIRNMAGAK